MRNLTLATLLGFSAAQFAFGQTSVTPHADGTDLNARNPFPRLDTRAPLNAGPVTRRTLPTVSLVDGSGLLTSPAEEAGEILTVKFRDGLLARARDGALVCEAQLDSAQEIAMQTARNFVMDRGATWRAHISLDPQKLAALEQRAAQRSGRAQPDLAGILALDTSALSPAEVLQLGEALRALPVVEYVYLELTGQAPPGDIAPMTPDHETDQGYLGVPPGMGVEELWAMGVTGAGVRLSDCEYGWDPDHEDLVDRDLHLEPGQTISGFVYTNGWDDHGTAVLGESSALVNGYGVSGMAHGSEVYTYPEHTVEEGSRRVTAITNAIAESDAGDVVLLEMQTVNFGSSFGPAELNPSVFAVVSTGVAAGVIVVGAAGNGNQDLDSNTYSIYQGWGDSGAILVGAGSPNNNHDKLGFSTYGSRVNLQGWGQSVFTLGYGGFATYGGDEHQTYTSTFNGTSSASPFVASACCLLQSRAMENSGAPIDPLVLRSLLISTGTAQGSGGNIGPYPDLPAALDSLCPAPADTCPTSANSIGSGATLAAQGTSSVAANDLVFQTGAVPPMTWGLVFYGSESVTLPVANGTRCAGGILQRLTPFQSDVFGDGQFALDVTSPPQAVGQINAGSTWYFQYWYRDIVGAGSNFSNGLQVSFCP